MADNTRKFMVGGSVCLVIGVVVLLGGILSFVFAIRPAVNKAITNGILDNAIVTSNDSAGYSTFASNHAPNNPPYYSNAYMYNLTNAAEILCNQSVKPIYKEIGPYIYLKTRDKFNVQFYNQTEVSYQELQQYFFVQEGSVGNDTDIIVNINPAYIGALATAGNDQNLQISFIAPSLKYVFDWYKSQAFLDHLILFHLEDIKNFAIKNLTVTENEFYETWANATTPSPQWKGMYISKTTPSNLSLDVVTQLWNPALNFSLANYNTSYIWYEALFGSPTTSSRALKLLKSTFQLTPMQIDLLSIWLSNMTSSQQHLWALPCFSYLYNCTATVDLAYLQFTTGQPFDGQSVVTLFPNVGNNSKYFNWTGFQEYFPNQDTSAYIEPKLMKNAFEDPNISLFAVLNFGNFMQHPNRYRHLYNLTVDQASFLQEYLFFDLEPRNFANTLWSTVMNEGGGLITTRTVREWLYDAMDPLLYYAEPTKQNVALLRNDTSRNQSAAAYNASLFYTGKDNNSLVQWIINYQGQQELDGIFPKPLKVWGTNDWGQFQPFLDKTKNNHLFTFSDDNWRILDLFYNQTTVTYDGVELMRFHINQSLYAVDPAFYQGVLGFNNLTGANQDATIFISNPHFAGADPAFVQKVDGIVQNQTLDVTYIDIEPNTGLALNAWQGMQINIFINNSDWFILYPNCVPPQNIFYPIAWIAEYGSLNENVAKQIKDIYKAQKLAKLGWLIFLTIGLICVILGVSCLALVLRRKRHPHPEHI